MNKNIKKSFIALLLLLTVTSIKAQDTCNQVTCSSFTNTDNEQIVRALRKKFAFSTSADSCSKPVCWAFFSTDMYQIYCAILRLSTSGGGSGTDTTKIPLAGTTATRPQTGTVEYRGGIATTALVDTVGGYYIGAGNRKDLFLASIFSRLAFLQSGGTQILSTNASGQGVLNVNPNSSSLSALNSSSVTTGVNLTGTTGLISSTYTAFAGLTYSVDYSSNYTSRSLIDKGYADGNYANTTTLTTNGINYYNGTKITNDTNFKWIASNKTLTTYDNGNGDASFSVRTPTLTTNSFSFSSAGNYSNSILQGYIANYLAGGYEWWGIANNSTNTVAMSIAGLFSQTTTVNNYPCVQIRGGKRSGTSLAKLGASDRLIHFTKDPAGNSALGSDNVDVIMGDGSMKIGDVHAPARPLEVLNTASYQLRLTQKNDTNFSEFKADANGLTTLLGNNASGTSGGLFVNPSSVLRDGGWNTGIEIQANATNAYPIVLFSNQTGGTRTGGIVATRSTSGNTSTSQQSNIQFLESSNVGIVDFKANGNIGTTGVTSVFKLFGNGSVVLGPQSALSTSATDGFSYMPSGAGTPTGVPTAITGKVAFYYDTTNNFIYIYNGGWKKIALAP